MPPPSPQNPAAPSASADGVSLFDRQRFLAQIILRLSIMQECLKWHSSRGENDMCKGFPGGLTSTTRNKNGNA